MSGYIIRYFSVRIIPYNYSVRMFFCVVRYYCLHVVIALVLCDNSSDNEAFVHLIQNCGVCSELRDSSMTHGSVSATIT